ncbi:MAG: PEGA domain-containing protein [Bacteroidales bacterium]|nr:PEGA domain-containing protein [Bacteroidales bacterium]
MRRFFILLCAVFLASMGANAQLEVKAGSFKEVPGFVNVNPDPNYQTDDNTLPYAVIKVRTENINDKQRRQLSFKGNAGTFIVLEYKDGEVWVYLTAKYADYLKISHPDLSSTEFTLPYDLKPKCGYEMTLVNKAKFDEEKEVYNYLIVRADQQNAAIYIDNEFVGEQEVFKSYKAGEKHTWRIECDLYHTENGEVTITDKEGENVTVDKTLRPAYGYLNVTSTPESGAIVYIDGKKAGQTPYKTDKLASGEHKVRVMKEMFSAVEKTFTVTDGKTIEAPMAMAANFVSVKITTDSESDIYVDNEKKGKGSWNGRLSDGSHSLEARKVSHKTSIKNVELVLGKDETIVIPNPEPIYGTLDAVSNPIGAAIIVDGKNLGTTPRVLTNILIGTHELKLEKEGYQSLTKTITLDAKNKLTVNEKLEKLTPVANNSTNTANKPYTCSTITEDVYNLAMYDAEKQYKVDVNGVKNALIIVNIKGANDVEREKFKFYAGGNASTITVSKEGMIWLYITSGCTSLDIRHSDYGNQTINFDPLKADRTYRMEIAINYYTKTNVDTNKTNTVNGVFSVSSGRKVQFSKGNLQYQASTKTWRFAEHQWDVIGDANKNISSSYSGWIDLFGWGTSGYNGKNPWMTSITNTAYGNGERDIAGTNYDWGVYNTISNGEGKSWRTLTRDEWVYVFNTRSTSSGIRYAKAIVNGVSGVILLPDNWSSSTYSLSNTNKYDAGFSSNRISQSDWTNKFEANGAVFLPAAGRRYGTNVYDVGSCGFFWSASYGGSYSARGVGFSVGGLGPSYLGDCSRGFSVRVVCSAEN